MLSSLFEEEPGTDPQPGAGGTSRPAIPRPPCSRNATGLCGLSNLGATCYMNALLQTLHYTPEFREALFGISEQELGLGTKLVREIPVRLQELFAKLLLLDQDSVGVEELVNSFGWNNNEASQQHDVQELNRILFDAIESSLVGTARENLTSELFHGVSVQQITCQVCNHVSGREEHFLDIQVALSGKSGLEESMAGIFVDTELLEGSNRYQCDQCQCLVDAKRGCRIRKLPPILTFALLRFLYDLKKGERYKDTSRFQFPMCLDMSPYVEREEQDTLYDLFSVVIHSGSTHSGHYTAYIRDIDCLGTWADPGVEPVKLQPPARQSSTLSSDPIEFSSPTDLLVALLYQLDGQANLNKLCKKIQDQTGTSWNKRFKRQYGPMLKFIKDNPEFTVDESNIIRLAHSQADMSANKSSPVTDSSAAATCTQVEESSRAEGEDTAGVLDRVQKEGEILDSKNPIESAIPVPGECWYCFNDAQVTCIHASEMKNIFQGKTSAYMLFYRRRSLQRPKEARNNHLYRVPQRLQDHIAALQAALHADRLQYEVAINTLKLTLHSSSQYMVANGALHKNMEGPSKTLEIDQRKTIAELKLMILEAVKDVEISLDSMVLHIARDIPAGVHLYDCVSDNDQATLISAGITYGDQLFIWDGKQVDGNIVHCGRAHEPLLLSIYYPSGDDDGGSGQECLTSAYPKISTLLELRKVICTLLDCPAHSVVLSIVKHSSSIATLTHSKNGCTLDQLQLCDGDRLTAEKDVRKGHKMFAHTVADRQTQILIFSVENRCQATDDGFPASTVEVSKTQKVLEVKKHIIFQLRLEQVEGGGRLRLSDASSSTGLGPPLNENLSVASAGITTGCKVVLEPGRSPSNTEVFLTCTLYPRLNNSNMAEVVVDKQWSIRNCCLTMVQQAGLQGENWHLRQTNWCGEPAEVLEDESLTVEQCRLKSGDLLFIMEGRLPPKGFIRLVIYNYEGATPYSPSTGSLLSRLTGGLIGLFASTEKQRSRRESEGLEGGGDASLSRDASSDELPLHEQDPSRYYPMVPGSLSLLGDIEISRDSTVEDLKKTILTLPQLADKDIPLPSMLRLRELSDGRPGNIFKLPSQTLKRLKLVTGSCVCCTVLPNEELLESTAVVFHVQVRVSGERRYGNPIEVVYDTSSSTTATALCNHVSQLLGVPSERLVLAKHKLGHFDWIRIRDGNNSGQSGGGRGGHHRRGRGKRGKGVDKGTGPMNIKNAPVMLRDGDIVGVKDLQYDPSDSDDFTTPDDDRGKAILRAVQEDKRKRRKAKSADLLELGNGRANDRNKKQRKAETGIKIFVPDYSNRTPDL